MQIEIFSDVICPWCYIGKKRLDAALATELGEGVDLRWRPYQLYPGLPEDGMDRRALLQRRYGADADPARVPERIAAEAEAEGIRLRFDLIEKTPNTLLAHRYLEFGWHRGRQHALAEALFQAYFCSGGDVGDVQTLVQIGAGVGLDAAQSRDFLESDALAEEVSTQMARAPELGISGVPGYYLADAFLLPGAQSAEVMAQIIGRVKTKLAAMD